MATNAKSLNVDLNSVFAGAASQFQGLKANEPGQWPLLPKLAAWLAAVVVVLVLGWFALLTDSHAALDAERNKEPALKQDFRAKLAQIVALAEAGDIAALQAFEINPVSSSPKAMARYRDLCVIAITAGAQVPS